MKIVLVSSTPPPEGGIATWTNKYIEYFKKNDNEIILVNTALNGLRGGRINSKRNVWDEIKRTVSIIRNVKLAINSKNVDLIHINSSCSRFGIIRDYCVVLIAKKRRIPIIFHCHCNVEDQLHPRYGRIILEKICQKATAVLTLNSQSLEYIKSICYIDTRIVPNFVDERMLEKQHLIRDSIREVVFVGHVQESKGCREIIEVAKKMSNIHFTLVGPVNDYFKEINCPENVTFTGRKNLVAVKAFLEEADVYLFPSYTEGFSLSLVEAMAVGLPCIASSVGANRDMIESCGGVIVPIKDTNSIVEAFKKIESVDVRKNMSSWNIAKVEKEYLISNVLADISVIYSEYLK